MRQRDDDRCGRDAPLESGGRALRHLEKANVPKKRSDDEDDLDTTKKVLFRRGAGHHVYAPNGLGGDGMTADRLPKMRQTQRRMVTPDVYGRRVPNRSP